MKRCLHGLNGVRSGSILGAHVNRTTYIQLRSSTAFDPWHYLHSDTVRRDQNNSFQTVWEKNIGSFKDKLSAEEIELFEERVSKCGSFDEFYLKMKELFSPRRHDAIRVSRTWNATHNKILSYVSDIGDDALINVIFANDDVFNNEFRSKYLSQDKECENLLSDFLLSDLRYMCSLQAIDIYGGPSLSAVFGCRNFYHFNVPDANKHTAHWLTCLYSDRITLHDIVLLSVLNAIKEKQPINQLWFKNKLESLENSAIKDEDWRDFAKEFSTMDTVTFNDKLDRAFLAFQTDSGVSELQPKWKNDI